MYEGLIYDVGMHTGKDTEFYLKKGFKVVAIEANPRLVEQVCLRLGQYLADGTLTICELAVAGYEGQIEFYMNDKHDDWGTISKSAASRNERFGATTTVIKVKCTQFQGILRKYGIPYYLKVDIEGADSLCLEALSTFEERPKYISLEVGPTSFEETFTKLSLLWNLGYRSFKTVNQAANRKVQCQNPPLEGSFVDYRFDGTSSGPFGEEAPGNWMSIEETVKRFRRLLAEQKHFGPEGTLYKTIFHRTYEILRREPVGWYDLHAKLRDR